MPFKYFLQNTTTTHFADIAVIFYYYAVYFIYNSVYFNFYTDNL